MHATARFVVAVVRRVTSLTLLAVILVLLARLAALLMPAARVDALPALGRLRAAVDPPLVQAFAWLGFPWPSRRHWYLLVIAAALTWMLRELCTGYLDRWHRALARAPRTPAPAPAPADVPASAPAAVAAPEPHPIPAVAPAPAPAPPPAPAPARAPIVFGANRPPAPAPDPTLVPSLEATELQQAPAPMAATDDLSENPTLDGSARPAPVGVARRAPAQIGRYEVLEELGRGAMGVVYRAKDPQIGRQVAIKTILAANLADESVDQYKKRFAIEARAAGQLTHPGIVGVHDITEDAAGQPSLIMEFVDGDTLENIVASDRAPTVEQLLELMAQVADALDYAHGHGVVHRDIKPANILVTRSGQVKLTDFGVAKLDGVQLTSTGMVIGTPAFMSPEQFNGAAIDPRSDIFSLGSVLYWVLTGQKPFAGDTITAIGYKVMFTDPPPIQEVRPNLPPALATVISRCLAKDRAERYATARQLATELRAIRARPAVDFDATRPDLISDPTIVDGPGPDDVS